MRRQSVAWWLRAHVLLGVLLCAIGTAQAGLVQEAYLKAIQTSGNRGMGQYSMAMSGDTLVIGAPGSNEGAMVFVHSGGAWTQQAFLQPTNADIGDYFGTSVAISGDIIVVGAPKEGSNASGINGNGADNSLSAAGAAYVFVRTGTTWTQQAYLKAQVSTWNAHFGTSVAVSGETVVIGAFGEDGYTGSVYAFQRTNGAWSQQARLLSAVPGGGFGQAVAIEDETIVVGAENEARAPGVNTAGATYVFVRNGIAWAQQARLIASNAEGAGDNGQVGDRFGSAVAISGETIVVGAYQEGSSATGINGNQLDNSARSSGAAYVFVRNSSTWTQQAYVKASNTGASDGFGHSVAISGDSMVIGAANEASSATGIDGDQANNSVPYSGAAYAFMRTGSTWRQRAYLKASNTESGDNFGSSVATWVETVVVGAGYEASNATVINGDQYNNFAPYSGAAYAFDASASPIVEDLTISSLRYPYPDVWTQNYPVFDGNPLKLEAHLRNNFPTSMTAVVDFARSDYAPISGATDPISRKALASTSVTLDVPANGTAIAAILIPSDGLSRNEQGGTRLDPIEFSASVSGVGKVAAVRVKPRPIFLLNGIWSSYLTWDNVVLEALARPDGALLTVVPVPGLLTSDLVDPTIPYNRIATNVNVAHDFIQSRRESSNFWKYYLVGHSMGGLMIRQYLDSYNLRFAQTYPPPLTGTAVERIFTIGTPYLGSRCADVFVHVRDDVRELTTDSMRAFNQKFPFVSFNSVSLAAFSTPPAPALIALPICGETGESDGVVSKASATINETIPRIPLLDILNLNPIHTSQTSAAKLFDLGIAPNTIGPPTLPAQATAKPTAQVAATSATVSSEWNAGSGSSALPGAGGCAVPESVRVPSGNVSLSLLSNGAGTATITSPAGDASETPIAPLFSGAMFTPSQAGTWGLQLCSTSGGASFAQWSAMVAGTLYTHEVSDVLVSGGNQLIPVRVGVAAGAPLPLSASYVLSSLTQKQTGSLLLSELLQSGSTIPIDSSLFVGEQSLQLEIALVLPDGVVLRTITTVGNDAIFASSFE